jgi:alkanesulfonate monooxygenase SsuD/methylene tetrahydromethanopterin reductase-like flavin-dependent oxidoreductase (luciferase family)
MVEWWRRIEAWGFDSLWDCDHFVNPYQSEQDWFEGWTLLAALATQTSRIRIGTLVTAIPFHNPAFLARQCMTVDHISNGRLEIGLGAGSLHDPSYHMTGIENYPARERAIRCREAVEIIDQLLREGESSYQGTYYSTEGALLRPAPSQRPRPPFTLAAHGHATMKVAARYADTWNVYSSRGLTLEQSLAEARERNATMDRLCGEIGRDPGEIRRSLLIFGAQESGPLTSVAAFEEFVQRFRAAGMDEFIMYYPPERFYGSEATSAIFERIATEALPRLRATDRAAG